MGCSLAACNQDPYLNYLTATHNPPPVIPSACNNPPSLHTLTKMATGFNIAWKRGNVIATRKGIKELEKGKKTSDKSVLTGTNHAFEILGESNCTQPVCLLRGRVPTSQSAQTGHGIFCSQYSNSTNTGMPPPPQHTEVKHPLGKQPVSCYIDPTINRALGNDSVE